MINTITDRGSRVIRQPCMFPSLLYTHDDDDDEDDEDDDDDDEDDASSINQLCLLRFLPLSSA